MTQKRKAIVIALFFISFYFFKTFIDEERLSYQEEFLDFTSKVVFVEHKLGSSQITVEVKDGKLAKQKVLLSTGRYPEYSYGDILDVNCKIQRPEEFEGFAYDKYLALKNIYWVCYRPRINIIYQEKSRQSLAFKVKDYFSTSLNKSLPEPEGTLIRAMLLAERKELPTSLRDQFSQVGLSHIIAISGLHIAIIVFILKELFLLLGLSTKRTFYAVLNILVFYLLVIGFPASAVRASFLALTLLLSLVVKRKYDSLYTLILVAFITSSINPLVVRYDIGWQLSFLAVLGLLIWTPWLERWFIFLPEKYGIRTLLSATLAAQVFTWPLIVYYFGIVSFVSPLVNILVVPFLPAILILGILIPMVYFVPYLSIAVSGMLYFLLHGLVLLVEQVTKLGGYVYIHNFSTLALSISLAFMVCLTLCLKKYESFSRSNSN